MDTNTIINNNIISKNNSNSNNNNSTDDDDTIAADASIVAKLEYVASYSKVSLHESLSALYQWSLIEVTPSIPQHINNSSSSSSSSRGGDDKMLIFFQSKAIDIIFTTIINDDTLPLTANSVIREVFKSLLVNVLSFEHSPTQKPVGLIVNRFVFTYVV